MAKWCRRFSKTPSKEIIAKWKDEEEGCEVFGSEYDPDDRECKDCCKETPDMWYWCRMYTKDQGAGKKTDEPKGLSDLLGI